MTTKSKSEIEEIHPLFAYRLGSRVVEGVIGLKRTQRKAAQARGEIPRPVLLTAGGKTEAYLGSQLIEIHQKRLAAAEAAEAEQKRIEAAEAEPKPLKPPKPAETEPPERRRRRGRRA